MLMGNTYNQDMSSMKNFDASVSEHHKISYSMQELDITNTTQLSMDINPRQAGRFVVSISVSPNSLALPDYDPSVTYP